LTVTRLNAVADTNLNPNANADPRPNPDPSCTCGGVEVFTRCDAETEES